MTATPSPALRAGKLAAPLVLASVLAASCGAQIEEDSSTSTATVKRCGEPVEYQTPQRAVVYEGGSADKMFALGLTEHVHGYVMPPANPPVSESPWAEEYEKVEFLGDDLLNRELVVQANSDFVVAGWNSGFSDQRGITPEILDRLEIQSFMHAESCYNYPEFPEEHDPFEGLYTDMRRLGKIFGVEDRAREVVADMKSRVQAVRDAAPEGEKVPVFLYDSGTDQPFTAGNQVPPNEIIEFAGGRNIFGGLEERWTQVGWEAVVEGEPEVIIILDYGDKPATDKIEFLKNSPRTSELPAVVNDNFYIMDYNEGISSPRNVDGLEKFGKYLREYEG
ncbi:ABC transporter substrate-binding protein [Streptomonospora litoralis]|uniref:Corrinoid ABC transporter substrate-binding protein n=1 Tax=Streptomonospora litoralis TaxID=2498135 RepID=A0A4P6Q2J2_9ACTN|nr:ABC transporter substrate-binding protein [Streptomonospora litoralis]QBI54858.1 corrinoid ABC transporter substrate-binding protein [Streptomonospora litoralis]